MTAIDFFENRVVLFVVAISDDLLGGGASAAACSPWPSRLFAFALLFPVLAGVEHFPFTHNGLFPFSGRQMRAVREVCDRQGTLLATTTRSVALPVDLARTFLGLGDAQPAQLWHPVLAPLVLGAAARAGRGRHLKIKARRGARGSKQNRSWTRGPDARTTASPTERKNRAGRGYGPTPVPPRRRCQWCALVRNRPRGMPCEVCATVRALLTPESKLREPLHRLDRVVDVAPPALVRHNIGMFRLDLLDVLLLEELLLFLLGPPDFIPFNLQP